MNRRDPIYLLTGWSIGPAGLQALADRLTAMGHTVIPASLPASERSEHWLPLLAESLPERSHWVGWSLGGQWLSVLTDRYGERCSSLMTLASNPCFVARPEWPTAMDAEVFAAFERDYRCAPEKTRQRFLQLVAQGCPEPRTLVRRLHRLVSAPPDAGDGAGLRWLSRLDTRSALRTYAGRQRHLLGAQDVLVPAGCERALRRLLPDADVAVLPGQGHGFPIGAPLETARAIDAFVTMDRA